MNLRIGALVVTVNLVFLAAAYAFFVRLSFQRLYPAVVPKRVHAFVALALASGAGLLGAWLYGMLGWVNAPPGIPRAVLEVPFGSFGGYWGVVLGSFVASALLGTPYLRQADAFIPGILVGGGIARLADLFNDANPGIFIHLPYAPWLQPFRPWAAYDTAIHLLALLLVNRFCKGGGMAAGRPLIIFLIGYGAMRFGIEFLRDTPSSALGPFTDGQIMSALQVVAGLALLTWLRRHPASRA